MRVVTPTDIRKRLGEILDAASAGERILIERDHRPLAWLVSVEDGRRFDEDRQAEVERSLAALDRLEEFSRRMAAKHPHREGEPTAPEVVRQMRDERAGQIDEAVRGAEERLGSKRRAT